MLRQAWRKSADIVWHGRRAGPASEGWRRFDMLEDPGALRGAMTGRDCVLCLAGVTPSPGARLELNADLACAAIRAAAEAGAGRVLLASSAAVYGRAGFEPLREMDPASPVSGYGRAKLDMERRALELAARLGHPATVLRIGNVAGADAMLAGWRPGMALDRFADGSTPRRSYIGPLSLARALATLSRAADLPEVMNLAAPGTVEMGALLNVAGLPWTPRPAGAQAIAQVWLDTARLERHVPFGPEESMAAGLVDQWRAVGAGAAA